MDAISSSAEWVLCTNCGRGSYGNQMLLRVTGIRKMVTSKALHTTVRLVGVGNRA